MTQLKPGDIVVCRIKNNKIVSPYSSYEEEIALEIIALDYKGYFFYVPRHYSLKNTNIINDYDIKSLQIDKKFLGSHMVYTIEGNIAKVQSILDGMRCCVCQEFFKYAEANQEDGSLKCWSCRNYRHYL